VVAYACDPRGRSSVVWCWPGRKHKIPSET
jgi:hypothetical protein